MLAKLCKTFMNCFFSAQDTGISVRKRVIKILRDICLEQPTFSKITEMCVRMIRRVNDEEGIKVWINWLPFFYHYYFMYFSCLFLDKSLCITSKKSEFERFVQIQTMTHDVLNVIYRNWWMRHSRSCGSLQLQPMTKRLWPERSSTSLMW